MTSSATWLCEDEQIARKAYAAATDDVLIDVACILQHQRVVAKRLYTWVDRQYQRVAEAGAQAQEVAGEVLAKAHNRGDEVIQAVKSTTRPAQSTVAQIQAEADQERIKYENYAAVLAASVEQRLDLAKAELTRRNIAAPTLDPTVELPPRNHDDLVQHGLVMDASRAKEACSSGVNSLY